MASSNKTPNLNLPQWELNDKPEMSDFNDAFNKVEDFKDEFDSHKADIVQTTEVNSSTKYPSAAVTYGLQQDLNAIDNYATNVATLKTGFFLRRTKDGFINIWGRVPYTNQTGAFSSSTGKYFKTITLDLPTESSYAINTNYFSVQLTSQSSGIYEVNLVSVTTKSIIFYVSSIKEFTGVDFTIHFDIKTQIT